MKFIKILNLKKKSDILKKKQIFKIWTKLEFKFIKKYESSDIF